MISFIAASTQAGILRINRHLKMTANAFFSGLYAFTAVGLMSLPHDAAVAQAVAPIPGKQCVFNNAAYSVNVEWYNAGDIVFKGGDAKDKNNYTLKESAKPAQLDKNITVGLKSCTNIANRAAIVKIVGYNITNDLIVIGAGTLVGVATGVAGVFACAGTAGAGCVTLAAVAPVAGGVIAGVRSAMPDVQEIAYIGSPGTQNFLDVSGTVWNVGLTNSVPLNRARGFQVLTDWVDGGERGPKSISFNNQAGYVAEITVLYMLKQKIGNTIVPLPVVKKSGNISLGFTRHIDIPVESENSPIIVTITGVATTKNPVLSVTVPGNFSGNKCYKSFGTIFNAQGSTC